MCLKTLGKKDRADSSYSRHRRAGTISILLWSSLTLTLSMSIGSYHSSINYSRRYPAFLPILGVRPLPKPIDYLNTTTTSPLSNPTHMVFLMTYLVETTQASLTGAEWRILAPLLGCSIVVAVMITMFVRRTAPLDELLNEEEKPTYGMKKVTSRKKLQPEKTYPNGRLDVWFGSQTGTAESFAKILAKEACKRGE